MNSHGNSLFVVNTSSQANAKEALKVYSTASSLCHKNCRNQCSQIEKLVLARKVQKEGGKNQYGSATDAGIYLHPHDGHCIDWNMQAMPGTESLPSRSRLSTFCCSYMNIYYNEASLSKNELYSTAFIWVLSILISRHVKQMD